MGAPDQFAKATFALDTAAITGGALWWEGPKEVGLTEVRLDGVLAVRAPESLPGLPWPWRDAARHTDIGLEVKMPKDHLDPLALWRAELRQAAWQVRRAEAEKPGWEGSVGFWMVAPHVPEVLRRLRALHPVATGCYAVGSSTSSFLWIAANELPLEEALIPFLVVRSGKALVEVVHWIVGRRPPGWVLRMLTSLTMDQATRFDLIRQYYPIEYDPDPDVREQREWLVTELLKMDPELHARMVRQEREEAARALLDEARSSLRRVLARRGFSLTAEHEARIDAQGEIEQLHRWLDQAVTAASVDEALA